MASLKVVVSFGVGLYTGLYVAQNYDIPPVDNVERFLDHLEAKVESMKPKIGSDGKPKTADRSHESGRKEDKSEKEAVWL